MMNLTRLEDSPMFRKQVQAGEDSAEILRDRCQKFYKGCRKYTEGLGEAYDSDIGFASTIEMFGGGHDDPISIAVGGPVMSKFTIALREIGTYKEVLRSQVEHMLNDRLMQFVNMDLQDVKEFRKRFDKASLHYDQVREKYMSLKKNTSISVVTEIEEDLHNARLAFEQARFNLVSALSNIESRKKYEFLEAVSGMMDAHLRYFKQGYELFCQMEPYIHQVLTYAQQCRERTNNEQAILLERMEEYKRQIEVESLQSSKESATPSGDGIQVVGRSSHRLIESIMQATSKGKVQAIKQGYLLKRSSNLRGDWKRRFFVLDSRGMLYYYRKQGNKPAASGNHQLSQRPSYSSDHVTGLFGRLLSSRHLTQQEENTVLHHTVNLLTSTIKVDAEQTDLRFCFRIISPSKVYTLQAESAIERTDWINKITAVIASLLSSQSSEQVGYSQRTPQSPIGSSRQGSFSETQSASSSSDIDHLAMDESTFVKGNFSHHPDSSTKAQGHSISAYEERPLDIMRKVPGNNECADCGCDEPDWASLNLGILLCIECSGVHRNLGVHISKVRSLTLDVKVWEPSVIHLFKSLGNMYANSVWEEHLGAEYNSSNVDERINEIEDGKSLIGMKKPHPKDTLSIKEKFIFSKYVEKRYVLKDCIDELLSPESLLWDAVQQNNTQLAYSIIVKHNPNIAMIYEQAKLDSASSPSHDTTEDHFENSQASTSGASSPDSLDSIQNGMHGCTLLHLACYSGGMAMIELLLQYGADVNARDKRGKTPLHHCISKGDNMTAKFLLRRGASTMIADNGGKTPLQRAMEFGAITDDELFLLLSEGDR